VIDTALILSPWSLLEVCQYGSLWHAVTSEKLQNVYQHFGFSCTDIHLIFWKKLFVKYTLVLGGIAAYTLTWSCALDHTAVMVLNPNYRLLLPHLP